MLAETELVRSYGGEWTVEDGLTVVGMGLWDAATIFQSRGVELTTDEIVGWMTDRVLEQVTTEVPWRPGARELLFELRQAGIPTAMVTMSVRRMAERIADALGFVGFDVIVGGDDVSDPKPHPAPYLHAAELLGVDITECVAIEDSVPGLASAVASGAVSIGIPLQLPLEEAPTHILWSSLAGRSVADIAEVFAERKAMAAL